MSAPFQFPKPVRSASGTAGPKRTVPPRPTAPPKPTVNKTRNGGGFNPSVSLSFVKATGSGSSVGAPADPGTAAGPAGGTTPGGGFMSNEDIQAWCEHVRKHARNRAVERAMDAEQLEQVLRHIPTPDGSMAGARLRSRRVSRHLKRIAKAEQVIAKEAAAAYAQFQREFESELSKVGKARPPQPVRFTF